MSRRGLWVRLMGGGIDVRTSSLRWLISGRDGYGGWLGGFLCVHGMGLRGAWVGMGGGLRGSECDVYVI